VLPTSRIDPNAVKVLNLFPLPTVINKLSSNFPSYIPIEDKNTNTWDIRIDDNISPKDVLFGVYDRSLLNAHLPGYFPGYAVGQTDARNDSLPAYAWAVGYTRILTPTLTNDMHVGMVHSRQVSTVHLRATPRVRAIFPSSSASREFRRWPTTAASHT
jgi:hypothetical protein